MTDPTTRPAVHACPSCDGIDPDTCMFNPGRPTPPAPRQDAAIHEMTRLRDERDRARRVAVEAGPEGATVAQAAVRRRALVCNAVSAALRDAGEHVPLSVRTAAGEAALARVDAWHAADPEYVADADAAQSDRWYRREQLGQLLSRMQRGVLLPAERGLLRAAVETELADAEQAYAQLAAVAALHVHNTDADYCDLCANHGDTGWPCATIRALGPQEDK